MRNSLYFKRLDYHKENVERKTFSRSYIEIRNKKEFVKILPISDFLKQTSEEKLKSIFYFQKSKREENSGLGDIYTEEAIKNQNTGYYMLFKETKNNDYPIVFLHIDINKENPVCFGQNYIKLEKNAKARVIILIDSKEEDEKKASYLYRNSVFTIELEENAHLELVKVQNLSYGARNFETTRILASYKSKLDFYPIDFGSEITASSCTTYMKEDWAEIRIHPVYFTNKHQKMDLEQTLVFNGKNDYGLIETQGVIEGYSKKIFRGNIFLNRGCTRSIGRFADIQMLLSKDARSNSIPTIFCDEDDVMGEHAASFSPVNKQKLYYLMSRGLSKLQAKKLVIEAGFRPIFDEIKEEEIKEMLQKCVEEKLK